MRNGIIVGIVLIAILSVFAISRNSRNNRPCRKLTEACKAAGFKRGHTSGERKAFFESCMKPLMETGTVGEIQIDAQDAQACKAKWGKRKNGGGGGRDRDKAAPDAKEESDDA